MAFPSTEIYNRRVRELTGQIRPRRPQRPPTRNENLDPLPHVQHFSNTLGVLNPHDGPIDADVFGYPVPPIATQADLDFYLSNPRQARPSATSSRLQVQDYEREGGWMVDALGRQYYQAHGKLEEISSEKDDNDIKSATNAFHDKNFNHHEPRRPLTALSSMNTGNGSGGINLREFASRSASPLPPSTTPPPAPPFSGSEDLFPVFSPPFISEYQSFAIIAPHTPSRAPLPPLPPNTTPPPRPPVRQMRELSPTSTVYPRHVVNGYAHGPTPLRTMTPAPPKNHAIIGPLDTETEIGLVQECLRLVTATVQDIQFMYTVCIRRCTILSIDLRLFSITGFSSHRFWGRPRGTRRNLLAPRGICVICAKHPHATQPDWRRGMEGPIGSVACQIWEEASFAPEVGFCFQMI